MARCRLSRGPYTEPPPKPEDPRQSIHQLVKPLHRAPSPEERFDEVVEKCRRDARVETCRQPNEPEIRNHSNIVTNATS